MKTMSEKLKVIRNNLSEFLDEYEGQHMEIFNDVDALIFECENQESIIEKKKTFRYRYKSNRLIYENQFFCKREADFIRVFNTEKRCFELRNDLYFGAP